MVNRLYATRARMPRRCVVDAFYILFEEQHAKREVALDVACWLRHARLLAKDRHPEERQPGHLAAECRVGEACLELVAHRNGHPTTVEEEARLGRAQPARGLGHVVRLAERRRIARRRAIGRVHHDELVAVGHRREEVHRLVGGVQRGQVRRDEQLALLGGHRLARRLRQHETAALHRLLHCVAKPLVHPFQRRLAIKLEHLASLSLADRGHLRGRRIRAKHARAELESAFGDGHEGDAAGEGASV
mmetsp:Transcript_51670/g.118714  ORF Transcript_51670/g.118714 Transcript_51670/m.118714 type:complete len:246 (-) Transcript_51670:334-1071(-)